MPAVIPSGREQFLTIDYPELRVGTGGSIPIRSNSAPADQARFTVTGPATARRGQRIDVNFNATLPGNASGAYFCTLFLSETPQISPNDALSFFSITMQGNAAFILGRVTIPDFLDPGPYFLGITCRDNAVVSPAPQGFPIQVTAN